MNIFIKQKDFQLPLFRTRMDARLSFGNDVDNMCGILKGETNRAPRVLVVTTFLLLLHLQTNGLLINSSSDARFRLHGIHPTDGGLCNIV